MKKEIDTVFKIVEEDYALLEGLSSRKKKEHLEETIKRVLKTVKEYGYIPDEWTITEIRSLLERLKRRNNNERRIRREAL